MLIVDASEESQVTSGLPWRCGGPGPPLRFVVPEGRSRRFGPLSLVVGHTQRHSLLQWTSTRSFSRRSGASRLFMLGRLPMANATQRPTLSGGCRSALHRSRFWIRQPSIASLSKTPGRESSSWHCSGAYGLRPYRYLRQRRNTVMVRIPPSFVDQLWAEFVALGDRPRISPTPALDLFFPTLIDRSPCV